jgi:hypothetical protein
MMDNSLNNNNDKQQCESVLWGMPWGMPKYILTLFFIVEEILRTNGHTTLLQWNTSTMKHY